MADLEFPRNGPGCRAGMSLMAGGTLHRPLLSVITERGVCLSDDCLSLNGQSSCPTRSDRKSATMPIGNDGLSGDCRTVA
jgi:hypothetical protein